MTILSFEDFTPGHFGRFGPRRVTREEIVAFAEHKFADCLRAHEVLLHG